MDLFGVDAGFLDLERQLDVIRADMERLEVLVSSVESELVRFRDSVGDAAMKSGRLAGQVAHFSGKGGGASLLTGVVVGAAVLAGGALIESAVGWYKKGEVREREQAILKKTKKIAHEKRSVISGCLVSLRPIGEGFRSAMMMAARAPIHIDDFAWSISARPGIEAAFSGWCKARHMELCLNRLQQVLGEWEAGNLVSYTSPWMASTQVAVLCELRDEGLSPVDSHFAFLLLGDVAEQPEMKLLGLTRLARATRSTWAWRLVRAKLVPFTQRSKQVRAFWDALFSKDSRMLEAYQNRVSMIWFCSTVVVAIAVGVYLWWTTLLGGVSFPPQLQTVFGGFAR